MFWKNNVKKERRIFRDKFRDFMFVDLSKGEFLGALRALLFKFSLRNDASTWNQNISKSLIPSILSYISLIFQ